MEIKNEKLASAEVSGFLVKNRLREYAMLSKLRLASSVVFSAIAGYLLGADTVQFSVIVALTIGGLMVVAASNAFNQVIEKDRDAKMDRTKDRPVAANRLSRLEAMLFASAVGLMGLWLLYYINPMSAMFGALSIFIYVLIYTPMKAVSGWAVFVGAFPGAIPFMLGWVAATNSFGVEPGTLFAIQFMWQFPHFWAIAWLVHDDYLKAGYNLLPTGKRDSLSAFLAVVYSVGLVLVSLVPYLGITGALQISEFGLIGVLLSGVYLVYKAVVLLREQTKEAAKKLMLSSILYLTVVQILYVIDKFAFL
ncbi:MAG: heme o synthase [Schleiferiaceae bacterium]|nr:heme o synthase [Schleiferiaceae bacterium]